MQITTSKHYQQVQPEERVTLAYLHFQKFTVREIARTLGRSPSTVSRVLARSSIGGHYASKGAEVCSAKRRIQARPAPKFYKEGILFVIVH
jgi:IS30 family transposase